MAALVAKEFQTWLQTRPVFALVVLVVLTLGLGSFLLGLLVLEPHPGALPSLFGAFTPPGPRYPDGEEPRVLPTVLVAYRPVLLFGAGAMGLLLVVVSIAPALAATAFGVERTSGTLNLLLLHGGRAGRATGAKTISAVLFMGLLCFVGLPSLAPAWMLGGVSIDLLVAALVILSAALVLACAVGVLVSAIVHDTLAAAFLAQAAMLGLTIGVPAAFGVAQAMAGSELEAARPILWLSPLPALLSAGDEATATLFKVAPAPLGAVLSLPNVAISVFGLEPAPWWPSIALWLLLAGLCWMVASVAIDPCHPARSWPSRLARSRSGHRSDALAAPTTPIRS